MKETEENWDLVIRPTSGLLDLKLKQVWKYRDLLWMFVKRDFISFYKQTILGPVWFFIQPLFTMGVYMFVFGSLAGISTDELPQPLFYLAGITAWTYFSECLTKTSRVFIDNVHIFGKVYFPRIVMPLSIIISSLIKLSVQLSLLVVMMAYYFIQGATFSPSIYILLFPILLFLMASLALGLGMIVSSLTTKYRDLVFLITFGVQLLMYSTTVVYPLSSLYGVYRLAILANPMTTIIEGVRLGFLGQGSFTWLGFLYTCGITALILFIGTLVFNKVEKNFVDTV
ncbi:MAG: ABC transporter permease [Imperialibacter sp.]|uniref:ABC transporter permease n=1 Tax=Imperialibacter sp. TaxID=2038411 RepID=UPI0030D966C8